MPGEGYRIAIIMIAGFVLMALAGIGMVATGKTDVATLKELFLALCVLAGLFGLPQEGTKLAFLTLREWALLAIALASLLLTNFRM